MTFNQENILSLQLTVSSMLNSVAIFSARPCSFLLFIHYSVFPLFHLFPLSSKSSIIVNTTVSAIAILFSIYSSHVENSGSGCRTTFCGKIYMNFPCFDSNDTQSLSQICHVQSNCFVHLYTLP